MVNGRWRIIAASALLGYCAGLMAWIGPDPWMVYVWAPLWALITIPAVLHGIRGGADAWTRAAVPWSAGIAFSIVAVLSSVLESRVYPNVGAVFWMLGLGMVGAVALFLMSYDRSKRPPAEAE